MSKARPKSAEELRTLVESILSTMPEKAQRRFWHLMNNHPQNIPYQRFTGLLSSWLLEANRSAIEAMGVGIEETNKLIALLKKHRNPVRNAERDAEILKLDKSDKTDGEIVRALRGTYPTLTTGQVRAVISRNRKNNSEPHGSIRALHVTGPHGCFRARIFALVRFVSRTFASVRFPAHFASVSLK